MISPRKNKGKGSPSKENVSPSRNTNSHKDEKSVPPEMLLSIIHELQMLVIKLGGKIPAHLTCYFGSPTNQNTNEKFSLGLIKIQGKQQEYKRRLQEESGMLRIKVSNYQFQIKKLEEDIAEYKLLSKMDKQKQIKKLRTQISRLEAQLKQDNKKWQEKVVEMRDLYEANKNKEIMSLKVSFQAKIKEETGKLAAEINILRQKSEQERQKIETDWGRKVKQVQERNKLQSQTKQRQYSEQKAKIKQRHSQQTKKSQKKYESIITALQSEKKVENRKRTQEKIQASKEKEKLYNNLYLVRKDNQYLKNQIQQLKQAVRQLNKQLEAEKRKTEEIEDQKQRQVEKIKRSYDEAGERIRIKQKSDILKIYEQHQREIRRFEKLIANLEQLQKNKEDFSKSQYQDLARNYQKRQSKLQDITLINQLNYELMLKKNQITNLSEEIKQIKMERENNEKNYNRIFTCQTSRERTHERPLTAAKPKPYHKHGNTIDMSFLLKVCNKNC